MRQRKDPTRKAAKNLGNVKIEATASDGAENASDHFVTFFLVLGHRKGGASKEAPPQPVEKPRVGCYCLQTALRWFAGEVLQHKG